MIEFCQLKDGVRTIFISLILASVSLSGHAVDLVYRYCQRLGCTYYDEVAFGGDDAWLKVKSVSNISSVYNVDIPFTVL